VVVLDYLSLQTEAGLYPFLSGPGYRGVKSTLVFRYRYENYAGDVLRGNGMNYKDVNLDTLLDPHTPIPIKKPLIWEWFCMEVTLD
jgi:hypothetical protein